LISCYAPQVYGRQQTSTSVWVVLVLAFNLLCAAIVDSQVVSGLAKFCQTGSLSGKNRAFRRNLFYWCIYPIVGSVRWVCLLVGRLPVVCVLIHCTSSPLNELRLLCPATRLILVGQSDSAGDSLDQTLLPNSRLQRIVVQPTLARSRLRRLCAD